ncbi:ATP-dependent DNA ligase [Ceratobasidium sp. AG-Ba]|nr:ATP-dependent DNA ligase [Ceratobasidium sp. AG-Ba]
MHVGSICPIPPTRHSPPPSFLHLNSLNNLPVAMNARIYRGYLGVFGPEIDALARNFIAMLQSRQENLKLKNGEYHITTASKFELQSLRSAGTLPSNDSDSLPGLTQLNNDLGRPSSSPIAYGIGGNQQGVYWVTVVWAAGQKLRSQWGLAVKHFHITLTSVDEHDIDKGPNTVIWTPELAPFIRYILYKDDLDLESQPCDITLGVLTQSKEEYLMSLAYGLIAQNEGLLSQSAAELLVTFAPHASRSFVCLGDVSFQRSLWKLAMLSFGSGLDLHLNDAKDEIQIKNDRISTYCLRQLRRSAEHTEWGAIFIDGELEELAITSTAGTCLRRPWSAALRVYLQSAYKDIEPSRRPSRSLESRTRVSTWQIVTLGTTKGPYIPLSGPEGTYDSEMKGLATSIKDLDINEQPLITESRLGLVPDDSKHNSLVQKHITHQYILPRFFRWLVPFYLALMSTPRSEEDIKIMSSPYIGIRHVITLTEESPLPETWFQQASTNHVRHTHIPIPNYQAPTMEQMDLVLRRICEPGGSPVLIHCGGGKGRAGTVAACYLAAFGFLPIPEQAASDEATPAMSANEAISVLRLMRPGSIETTQQEDFVKSWVSALWKRRHLLLPRMAEPPPTLLSTDGIVGPNADLLVLCGLPGSGKSWFSQAILRRGGFVGKSHEGLRNPVPIWRIISQDESGSRATCENAIGRPGLPGSRAILDRCNPTSDERRLWIGLASWALHPVCVWFDYDPRLCIDRGQNRACHPTLPSGPRVRTAVASMQRSFQSPLGSWKSEGFEGVAHITSFEAAMELCRLLSPAGLLKFPRTPHLLNLGAATDDDILARPDTPPPVREGDRVVITEKIDGANLGFSLSPLKELLVQNRSHYIHSGDHAQFKDLDTWIADHREGLYMVLDRDIAFPERYVLYGEWMAATHSIAYTCLRSLFYAFDLFDRATNTFVSRSRLELTLAHQGIELTPVIAIQNSIPTNEELIQMVRQKSRFYPGPVEGVYVKVENNQVVRQRGKVVRGDFIAGNEHWSKGMIRWNVVLNSDA